MEAPCPGGEGARTDQAATAGPLGIVERLLAALERDGVRYCHWKSNWELDQALAGEGDLDLLIDRAQSSDACRALQETGFRAFQAVPWIHYPAVEDWLGLDPASGRIVHCHLHHRLVLGAKPLKEYRLPWEREVLASSTRAGGHGPRTPSPEIEMLLFLVRGALKTNTSGALLRALGHGEPPERLAGEFAWLASRASTDGVLARCREWLGDRAEAAARRLLEEGPSGRGLRGLRRTIGPRLRAVTRVPWASAGALLWGRLARHGYVRLVRKAAKARPYHRLDPRGGIVVAIVGADGSGKSTVGRELAAWLRPHVDVFRPYFGSGDGPACLARRLLMPLRRALTRSSGGGSDAGPRHLRSAPSGHARGARLVLQIGWALLIACEKRANLARAWQASTSGLVVIADRYPQCEVMGSCDGPLLSELRGGRGGLLARLAEWEHSTYEQARSRPPDLVLRLAVSPETAHARKPERGVEWARWRVETVAGLTFGAARVVDVDAEQSLERVLLETKRLIWECM